ncbi:MAG: tRNA (adenosine(37)-N6)-threonylcarbamoyltransferase complex dimerization subunit type 1 TsaB [Bacillota bacterium]
MKAIIIDSTDDRLAVVAINGEKRHDFLGASGMRRHTSEILVRINECLDAVELKANQLTHIGVVVGPGSFTGIRIGVSTANAISAATGAKIVQITSLECLAHNKSDVLVLLDCKHDNYYALHKKGEIIEYLALNTSELDNYDAPILYKKDADINGMFATFVDKVHNAEYSEQAESFYMKKSSAEMQNDNK